MTLKLKLLASCTVLLLGSIPSEAESIKALNICGKKWFVEKIKEADGTISKPTKAAQSYYTLYSCDGAFESKEDMRTTGGQWSIDEASDMLILNDDQNGAYSIHVLQADGKHMVIDEQDANGNTTTVYLKAGK
jgi:hypothetical protein